MKRNALLVVFALMLAGCGGESKVESKTVEVAPKSCIEALDAAQETILKTGEYADLGGAYPDLVKGAGAAGVTKNQPRIADIVEEMDSIVNQQAQLVDELTLVVAEYKKSADKCRESSKDPGGVPQTTASPDPAGAASCAAALEAIATGTEADIETAFRRLADDAGADPKARESAENYLVRDANNPDFRSSNRVLVQGYCTPR